MPTPDGLYLAAQVRACDRHAIDVQGVPGYTLMERAAAAALRRLRAAWPASREFAVVCGGGNNGGDGYVLARLAQAEGFRVEVFAVIDPGLLHGDAARAAADCRSAGIMPQSLPALEQAGALSQFDVLVDAVLGIGLSGPLRADSIRAIGAIRAAGRPVLSLDIPSGLSADTGLVTDIAVRADLTVTFIACKLGLAINAGPAHAGVVVLETLGVDVAVAGDPVLERISAQSLRAALPRRPRDAHKGSSGHVMVLGGGVGMAGAARLAGEAALCAGAGRVTVCAAPESVAAITAGSPELMTRAAATPRELGSLLESADVLIIGPGLGRDAWGEAMLDAALAAARPSVIDADALNILAMRRARGASIRRAQSIWTPHPGEAARLLQLDTAAVQSDRLKALGGLIDCCGGTVVLKGAGSLVGEAGWVPSLCDRGTPALAVAGTGDVLTGVIAALWAQGAAAPQAARAGVWWHAV
ncbi:MAG: NAD(P)H-hydrate dehydratase, partial [Sinobacteraceae bacterium]|nr:NAD(P)H-hydrate dehydratase [Nevskiaceae bacterium]